MPHTRRGRSNWLGIAFLGIASLIAIATLVMAFTDRRLTDLAIPDGLWDGDDGESESVLTAERISATATAMVTPEPTASIPDPVPPELELTARSAFVTHPESGSVLFERAADEPVQPASTLKIFTALVVLDYASPEEVVEIEPEDVVDPVTESNMGLQAGDHVTMHDLLVGLLLPSGNDAAYALARTIGPRIEGAEGETADERFIHEMNRVAAELGLESTNLAHVAGHDREGQVVTAREMAVAAEALLERPSLATIVAMPRAFVQVGGANPRVLTLENTNELLVHEGVHGVKTGTTAEAGECLVVAYRDGDSVMIAVILGSEDRFADARALLDLPAPPEPEPGESDELHPEHTDPVEEPAEGD